MPPDDAVPGVASIHVPVDPRPRTSATGLRVKTARLILRATPIWPACAGRYWPVFWQQAMRRPHETGVGLGGTSSRAQNGHRDAARQQRPGEHPFHGAIVRHGLAPLPWTASMLTISVHLRRIRRVGNRLPEPVHTGRFGRGPEQNHLRHTARPTVG